MPSAAELRQQFKKKRAEMEEALAKAEEEEQQAAAEEAERVHHAAEAQRRTEEIAEMKRKREKNLNRTGSSKKQKVEFNESDKDAEKDAGSSKRQRVESNEPDKDAEEDAQEACWNCRSRGLTCRKLRTGRTTSCEFCVAHKRRCATEEGSKTVTGLRSGRKGKEIEGAMRRERSELAEEMREMQEEIRELRRELRRENHDLRSLVKDGFKRLRRKMRQSKVII